MEQNKKPSVKWFFACGKPWFKKWWVWVIIIILLTSLIGTPFIINFAYMKGLTLKEPNTAFSASDLLSFYGAILSLIGTIVLGIITIIQNNRVTEMNKKLMEEQQRAQLPELCIDEEECNTNTTSTKFKMDVNFGEDVCFPMQFGFGMERQVLYICLSIRNISQFSISGLKALSCQIVGLDRIKFKKVYNHLYERTTTLELNETKKIGIKVIDDTICLDNYFNAFFQVIILFECYNLQKRRCEFKVDCLIQEDKHGCQILADRLKVEYKKETTSNDNS